MKKNRVLWQILILVLAAAVQGRNACVLAQRYQEFQYKDR